MCGSIQPALGPRNETKFWELFGAIAKEGIYEDYERREQLLKLARFRTIAAGESTRSLAEYVGAMKEGQSAIYYISGSSVEQLNSSPHLEGFRARGIEVLLLSDQVDSFWPTNAPAFEGKSFGSVTQGHSDLEAISKDEGAAEAKPSTSPDVVAFINFARGLLGEDVADVRVSARLTESAVCLVAPDDGPDRQLEKILQGAGRLPTASKPILEINAQSALVQNIASVADQTFREDAVRLLLDAARILDGDKPKDPRAFASRRARMLNRAIASN